MKLTDIISSGERIRKIILGKAYNRYSFFLMLTGVELISERVWIELIVQIFNNISSFDLKIPDIPYYPKMGLTLIIIGVIFNLIARYQELNFKNDYLPQRELKIMKNQMKTNQLTSALETLINMIRNLENPETYLEDAIELKTNYKFHIKSYPEKKSIIEQELVETLKGLFHMNILGIKIPISPTKYKLNKIVNKSLTNYDV